MLKLRSFFRVNGLLLLFLGGFLFFRPETAFRRAVIIFSLEIIISGAIAVFFSWTEKKYAYRGMLFFAAVSQAIFGLLLLIFPDFSEFLVKFLVAFIGVGIIIRGIVVILASITAKEQQLSRRRIQFIFGIFSLLFGWFLATNAFFSFLLLNILLGLVIIIIGGIMFILGFQVKEMEKIQIHELE